MNWKVKTPNILQVKKYSRTLNISDLMAKVLLNRGVDIDLAGSLLNLPKSLLEDASMIVNAQAAADKIIEYLDKPNAEIWIFADYDVDGITSGFVMTDFLRRVTDNEVFVYYPDRDEHYGMNMTFCQNIVARKHHDNVDILVVTVDNGVACIDEVAYLQSHGVEIVVTDHHQPQPVLPDCIICDPYIGPDSTGHHLAGVGVAWKVCKLIDCHYIDTKLEHTIIDEYLFAVAIGTVADVMPLTPENIAFINLGLDQLNSEASDCPKAMRLLREHLDKESLTATDIAWDIAPRLNACGRMGDIKKGAVIFYMNDCEKHEIIDAILEIEEINEDRKSHTKRAEKAIDRLNFDQDQICIFDANSYPAGIAGPVAGKIAEKFNKPAFVLQGDKILSGSARSANGISLQTLLAIEMEKGNIISFGGHDAACGLSLLANKVFDFKRSMNESIDQMIAMNKIVVTDDEINIDCEIDLSDISNGVLKQLNALPYDRKAFATPTFMLRNLEVVSMKSSKNNENNICLTLKDMNGNQAQIWAWKFGEKYKALGRPTRIDLAGSIDKDFMSKKRCTLKVADMREVQKNGMSSRTA
jgi:single-stranded-DNA-specific exonuclease